jgi:hypothetical protein
MTMDQEKALDLDLSYGFYSTLVAAFSAGYSASEILIELKHPANPEKAKNISAKITDQLIKWGSELISSAEIWLSYSWKSLETERAKTLFKMIETLKVELIDILDQANIVLNQDPAELSLAELGWLLAQNGRCLFYSNSQILLKIQFGRMLENEDIIKYYEFSEKQIQEQIALLVQYIDFLAGLSEPDIDQELKQTIYDSSNDLIRLIYLQLHDLNLIYNIYNPNPTYTDFDFTFSEGEAWQKREVSPPLASFWRSRGFDPEEASNWLGAGFTIDQAFDWHSSEIPFFEALEWMKNQLELEVAKEWQKAGFNCEQALIYIQKGMKFPPSAKRKN